MSGTENDLRDIGDGVEVDESSLACGREKMGQKLNEGDLQRSLASEKVRPAGVDWLELSRGQHKGEAESA